MILSVFNVYLSSQSNQLSNTICDQLNILYLVDFLVCIVDVRSFYILDKAGMGYHVAACAALLDLILIVIVINETRLAPPEPVITESVSEEEKKNPQSLDKYTNLLRNRVVLCQVKIGHHFILNLCLVGSTS